MVPVRQVRCIWHTHRASPAHRILNTLSDLYKTLMHLCATKSSERQTAGWILILLVRISASTTRAMNLLQLQMHLLCLNFAIRPRGNVDENNWAAVLLVLYKRSILFLQQHLALQPQLNCAEKAGSMFIFVSVHSLSAF